MPVARKNTRRSYRKRRPMLKNVLMHQRIAFAGGAGAVNPVAISGSNLGILNRACRIKWATLQYTSADPHTVQLTLFNTLGERTAEDVKIKIGSAYESQRSIRQLADKNQRSGEKEFREKMAIVRGRDIETGLPKSLRLTEVEIREALAPVFSQILEAISDVLQEAPPELTNDILTNGILLTGGGSMIPGIDQLIVDRTHIPVILSEDPLTSVVRGTGRVLENDQLLQRVKVVGGLK